MSNVPWSRVVPWVLLVALAVLYVQAGVSGAEVSRQRAKAAREFGYGQGRYEEAMLCTSYIAAALKEQRKEGRLLWSREAVDLHNSHESRLEQLRDDMRRDASEYFWYSDENQLWMDWQSEKYYTPEP